MCHGNRRRHLALPQPHPALSGIVLGCSNLLAPPPLHAPLATRQAYRPPRNYDPAGGAFGVPPIKNRRGSYAPLRISRSCLPTSVTPRSYTLCDTPPTNMTSCNHARGPCMHPQCSEALGGCAGFVVFVNDTLREVSPGFFIHSTSRMSHSRLRSLHAVCPHA